MLSEALVATRRVGDVFDRLGVRWVVGGSLASSLRGIPRATNDVDVVAELTLANVAALVAATESEFYVDEDAVRDAVRRLSCFNLIELKTMLKIDVFVPRKDPLSARQLDRRSACALEGGLSLPVLSAEDVVLQKLRWFRNTGETSERQWRDVLGVIAVSGDALDLPDLEAAAESAALGDLLRRALDGSLTKD